MINHVPRKVLVRASILSSLILLLVSGAALVAAVDRPSAGAPKQTAPQDPISLLPAAEQDAARQKVIQSVKDSQPAFLAQFIASGRDVHSLPAAHLPVLGAPRTSSVKDAQAKSMAVIQGKVIRQTVGPEEVVSEFEVTTVLAGKMDSSSVRVWQGGGPFLNGDTPVLAESLIDPILWARREYVLFVSLCPAPHTAEFCMRAGGQQLQAIGGVLRSTSLEPEGDWTTNYSGKLVAELAAALASAP